MANTDHFRGMVSEKKSFLQKLHDTWQRRSDNPGIPDNEMCFLRSVLGQSQLLLTKKFIFMENFLKRADEEKDLNVNNNDLQGLWDMICIEIDDLDGKFKFLETIKANNWKRPAAAVKSPKITKKRKPRNARNPPVTSQKDLVKSVKSEPTGINSSRDTSNQPKPSLTVPVNARPERAGQIESNAINIAPSRSKATSAKQRPASNRLPSSSTQAGLSETNTMNSTSRRPKPVYAKSKHVSYRHPNSSTQSGLIETAQSSATSPPEASMITPVEVLPGLIETNPTPSNRLESSSERPIEVVSLNSTTCSRLLEPSTTSTPARLSKTPGTKPYDTRNRRSDSLKHAAQNEPKAVSRPTRTSQPPRIQSYATTKRQPESSRCSAHLEPKPTTRPTKLLQSPGIKSYEKPCGQPESPKCSAHLELKPADRPSKIPKPPGIKPYEPKNRQPELPTRPAQFEQTRIPKPPGLKSCEKPYEQQESPKRSVHSEIKPADRPTKIPKPPGVKGYEKSYGQTESPRRSAQLQSKVAGTPTRVTKPPATKPAETTNKRPGSLKPAGLPEQNAANSPSRVTKQPATKPYETARPDSLKRTRQFVPNNVGTPSSVSKTSKTKDSSRRSGLLESYIAYISTSLSIPSLTKGSEKRPRALRLSEMLEPISGGTQTNLARSSRTKSCKTYSNLYSSTMPGLIEKTRTAGSRNVNSTSSTRVIPLRSVQPRMQMKGNSPREQIVIAPTKRPSKSYKQIYDQRYSFLNKDKRATPDYEEEFFDAKSSMSVNY